MKHTKLIILILISGFLLSDTTAQEIWQSDMKVDMQQRKSGGYQLYEVIITTDNDDASRAPHLIFTLPRNSKVRGVKFDGRLDNTAYTIYGNQSQSSADSSERIDGYVKIDFPNLNRLSTSVTISIEAIGKGWQKKDGASAYVFSNTPELNKENNFIYLPLIR